MDKYVPKEADYIVIPASISGLDIPMTYKAVAASIFNQTGFMDKSDFVGISSSFIQKEWNIDKKSVTRALKWLKGNGYIEVKRTRAGNMVKWTGVFLNYSAK